MRHFETLAADVRQRIADLDAIEKLDQERKANRRRRITNGTIHRCAQADTHLTELKRYRLELDQKQLDLSRLGLRRDDLTEHLNHARQKLVDAQVALHTDTTAIREESLREEIVRTEVRLNDLRQRENRVNQTLARETKDAKRLQDLLIEDSVQVPESLQTFIQEQTTDNSPFAIRDLQDDIEFLGHHYAEQHVLLKNQSDQLRQEAEQLQREIVQLRTGDRDISYEAAAPKAAHLRRLLRAELGLGADQVIYLCTALHIPDESWQDAVEGILGRGEACPASP